GSTSGSISVAASNGCGTGNAIMQTVTPSSTVPPIPGPISNNITGTPCAGQKEVVYTVGNVSGASALNWTVPAGWTIVSGQGTPSITVNVGSVSGNVTVVAANGCGSSQASTVAQAPSATPPPAPGSIAGNAIPCRGSSGNVYSVPVVAGATGYTWLVPAGWDIISGQNTNSITVMAGPSNGTISVTASNTCGAGTASTLAVTSATTVPPAAGPITGDLDVCINQTNLTYTIAPVANASAYTWTVPTGWTITSGNNTNTITVT